MSNLGDPESLPNMPFQEWQNQSPAVWAKVAAMIRDGWFGRIRNYYESQAIREKRATVIPDDWLTYDAAIYAQSLGAPVGRFFTAAAIMVRNDAPPAARKGGE